MYYEVNVAKRTDYPLGEKYRYEHFFATAPRSITTEWDLQAILLKFKDAFPNPVYATTVTLWRQEGEPVDVDKILKTDYEK